LTSTLAVWGVGGAVKRPPAGVLCRLKLPSAGAKAEDEDEKGRTGLQGGEITMG